MLKNVSILALCALLACNKSEDPADTARNAGRPAQALDHYGVVPSGQLNLSLRGREAEPRAQLRGIRGELWVNPQDLSQTRGFLEFDLTELVVLSDEGESSAERTRLARHWLGPWHQPTDSTARLDLLSLSNLSAVRFEDGERIRDAQGAAGQRVRATLFGRLKVRKIVTDHRIPVWAELFTSGASGTAELRVRLLPGVSVSLLEPDIVFLATMKESRSPRNAPYSDGSLAPAPWSPANSA